MSLASYSLLIYAFFLVFFGFLEGFATFGQKPKRLEKKKSREMFGLK